MNTRAIRWLARMRRSPTRRHSSRSALRRLFSVIPTLNASQIDDERWVYRTRQALGAPSLILYYEIRPNERVVRLLAAILAD